MKLRTLLGGAAVGLGAAAGVDRTLRDRAGPLPPALVGAQRSFHWRGFEVSYTEAGVEDAPDVLLLHGLHAAASSREFEGVFDALADAYHVLAPDLPGFGRSDRPPATYTAALYEAFVTDFVREVTDRPVVVASSVTGAYATRAAAEGAAVERLVLVCPTDDVGRRRPLLRAAVRAPVVGSALFDLLASKPAIRLYNDREGYYRPSGYDEATVDYQWRTAHQRGARYAPASFVGGFLTPDVDLGETLADLAVPVTLVWGREATRTPLAVGRALAERADCRLVVVDDARLLPHDEHPAEFLQGIEAELPRLEDE